MKAYIEALGVIDKKGNIHSVELRTGLNIITGRSSTGKSALISIFDYCMGKRNNIIPRGEISERAELYFLLLKMETGTLVLARRHNPTTKAFIKPESSSIKVSDINMEYFSEDYFITLNSFIEELGQYMGLDLKDVDESKLYGSKKGRPSVRNMISFMIQPQNLIANNQGLFYRFDDSEHKDKVISEFKIFLGLVNQRYYIALNELESARREKRKVESKIASIKGQLEVSSEELDNLREQYLSITGKSLFQDKKSRNIVDAPQQYLDKLNIEVVEVDEESEIYKNQYEKLQKHKNELLGSRRSLEIKRSDIMSSINVIKKYKEQIEHLKPTTEAYNLTHDCPFCHAESSSTQVAANALTNAIIWLNQELREAPSLWKTYLPQLRDVEAQIKEISRQIFTVNEQISHVRKIGENLRKNNSLEQQAQTIKYQVSYLLSAANGLDLTIHEGSLESIENEISKLENEINEIYNLDEKLKNIEGFIDTTMNQIAVGFSFEEKYKPVKLHFDIRKFELYSWLNGEKVYLSSMGSAANWLYSHLCLFLALMKLFCKESDHCTIPPILFIDQPSQVYFPTITCDNKDKFSVEELGGQNGNEDLREVSNMFIRILDFIENVKSEYGIVPQIILTEHADELNLGNYKFEDYLVKRWRNKNEGLIQIDAAPEENTLES